MTPLAVDKLNLVLLALALGVAFAAPFELFLFAYAVLGPLHYLTEIGWLHERRFFTRGKHDWIPLACFAGLATLGASNVFGIHHVRALGAYGPHLTFAAFACALVFVRFERAADRILGAASVVALTFAFAAVAPRAWFLFGLFVTTIVHVAVFTLAFMLFGALKAKSRSALLVALAFVACSIFALAVPSGTPEIVSGYVHASYSDFSVLNRELLRFGGGSGSGAEIFASEAGTRVMRFIAFAYTYHYLNWFSKTSVIRWHEVHRGKLAFTVALWVASLVLYGVDYGLGARWLFLLSFAHVILEFPLNHVSFVGIGNELASRFRRAPSSP